MVIYRHGGMVGKSTRVGWGRLQCIPFSIVPLIWQVCRHGMAGASLHCPCPLPVPHPLPHLQKAAGRRGGAGRHAGRQVGM